MAKDQIDRDQSADLDSKLGITSDPGAYFSQAALQESGSTYKPWYGHLLSTLVVAAAGEAIAFARGEFEDDERTVVNVHVITTARVIFSRVDLTHDSSNVPTAKVIPRSALQELVVSASTRIDEKSALALAWPGKISIEATYLGLPGPVTIKGDAHLQVRDQGVSPVYELLKALQADLVGN